MDPKKAQVKDLVLEAFQDEEVQEMFGNLKANCQQRDGVTDDKLRDLLLDLVVESYMLSSSRQNVGFEPDAADISCQGLEGSSTNDKYTMTEEHLQLQVVHNTNDSNNTQQNLTAPNLPSACQEVPKENAEVTNVNDTNDEREASSCNSYPHTTFTEGSLYKRVLSALRLAKKESVTPNDGNCSTGYNTYQHIPCDHHKTMSDHDDKLRRVWMRLSDSASHDTSQGDELPKAGVEIDANLTTPEKTSVDGSEGPVCEEEPSLPFKTSLTEAQDAMSNQHFIRESDGDSNLDEYESASDNDTELENSLSSENISLSRASSCSFLTASDYLDDVLADPEEEVVLTKTIRPQFLGKYYLQRLANARQTAAEIKARKPEPRVKLDKPCRLDTNLTYAVRQSLKRSLPLIAGKNKLSALMVMADGMFDEMSLDRDLDDLAWPYDPLAELRKSGLAMVDYMDPHPAGGVISNKSLMKNQSAAMRSQSNKTIFDESQTNLDDDTSKEEEALSNDSQETFTNHDSGRCVDVSSESSAHKLDQCKGMLSESNKIDDIKKNHCDVTYEEQEMPSDNSRGTVTKNDSERCVDVSSESSAHILDQCKGMLSESNKTDDIKNNHCGATYEEQEMPSDNSQGTVTGNDSERCVDVSESSAHKLDQCKGMLSESNKTDDIKNNHCGATYEEQEMPSDNSQGTVTGNDSERCVDVSSELSAHKLDQCKGMLSESNKTVADHIKNNHCDATYGEQEMPSDNSLGPVANNDPGRCVDVPMEASAYKLELCPAMLSESNGTIFDDIQNNCGGKISSEQEIPFDNSQGIPTDCGSERCVDVSTESSAHNLNHFEGMLSESNKTIIEDIQKNQNDSRSDVQELLFDNFQGSGVVNERDITIFNAVRDIRKDQEILSSRGTTLEVSEEGCAGVSKEVPIHKQYHVPADLGEKGTSASNYIDVKPESQEIPSDQPVVTDHDEENSAYVKEDTSGYEMNQSLDNANNPVMERSKNNGSINLRISDNSTDDDDKDMLNEVYQSCVAKEMRPKYISKNYLKNLANARKTAEEIKARKPEPRVKLDKPCRLDTNLTYAVRQSLKRSLPLIAGKNKLSALMVMADGMFDEMSLDRDLDDLAWPYDPLAELRKSGLAMVDYMDPHPARTPTMNTSDMKDQSSPSDSVVPFASSQDENDHNSSGTVVKIPDSVATIKSPLPTNEQRSMCTDFSTKVSRLTCQPSATAATEDLPSPQHNSTETSLGTTVLQEDLPDSSIENDSEIGSSVEIQESSHFDNLIDNHNILIPTVKCDPVDLKQISSIDLIPPSSHSSDIVQTMSVDSDLQSEDSALGQDNSSTSLDDTCSTSDFSSDIEEVDPSSQNLKQKIQFFSNATWTSFSKPSSVSRANFKVSVPAKVHHFEKLAQEERSSKPQNFLAKDHRLATHNRLSSAGDAKIKIEQFERKRVPTIPIVNTKHDTTDSIIKEDTSASKVNVMNRVKMFELSEDPAVFNKPPTSATKPKITGRLNKSKIAFFEHLANSNI